MGYFEAKIDDMPADGWHATFWLWHHEEIDIMERFNDPKSYKYNSLTAIDCDDVNHANLDSGQPSLFHGPHIPAADLTPFKLTFFHNGSQLPEVVYRFYTLDGTPLNLNCGDQIPEGNYLVNPYFPKLYREKNDGSLQGRYFRPIIDMDVLPKYGYNCCDINVYCDDENCDLECSNWGHPWDDNTNSDKEGHDSFTEMVIDRVTVKTRDYEACNSILIIPEKENICVNEDFYIKIEDIGNSNILFLKEILSVSTSSHLELVNNENHKYYFSALASGVGKIYIDFLNCDGNTTSVTYDVKISRKLFPINDITWSFPWFTACCFNVHIPYNNGAKLWHWKVIDVGSGQGLQTFTTTEPELPDCFFTGKLFYVSVTSTNECGQVTEPYIEMFVGPNEDDWWEYCNVDKLYLFASPNPAENFINLFLQDKDGKHLSLPKGKLSIYNNYGSLIYELNTNLSFDGNLKIDISNWEKGIYTVFISLSEPVYLDNDDDSLVSVLTTSFLKF